MAKQVVEEARARVEEIDDLLAGYDDLVEERKQLVSLIGYYERKESPVGSALEQAARQMRKDVGKSLQGSFQRPALGPTERVLAVVRQSPGLNYSQIVNQAADGLQSAGDPKKSVASTLQSLVTRGRIVRNEGKHYIAEGAR